MSPSEINLRGHQEPPSDRGRLLPKAHGTHGMQGKSILQLHKIYYGVLRGGTKYGNREGDDDKRDRWLVSRLLVSMFFRLCPAPDQRSLSCLLIKVHFKLFLGEGISPLHARKFGGLSISNWSWGLWLIQDTHLWCQQAKGLKVSEIYTHTYIYVYTNIHTCIFLHTNRSSF